jgi:hypothetical protein
MVPPWKVESWAGAPEEAGTDLSGYSHSGAKSAFVYAPNANRHVWTAIAQDVTVNANTDYHLTVFVRPSSNVSEGYFGAQDPSGNVLNEVKYAGTGGDYRQLTVDFNSNDNTVVHLYVGAWSILGATSWVNIDDVSLTQSGAAPPPPPSPPSVGNTYNDNHPAVVYSRGSQGPVWQYYQGQEDIDADEHSTNVYSSSFSIAFAGTDFAWIGKKGPQYGIANLYLDGRMVGTLDNYNPTELDRQTLYSVSQLSDGAHVFRAAIGSYPNPARNGAAVDTYQTLDAFVTSGTPLVLPVIAASGSGVTRTGSWTCGGPNGGDISNSHCWSNVPGSTMSITFTGTGLEVIDRPDGENGMADVYLDGDYLWTYDGFGLPYDSLCGDCVNGQANIVLTGLPLSQHTLTLVVSANKNPAAEDRFTQIDAFMILP